MLINYLQVFVLAMVPLIEIRGAIPLGVSYGLPTVASYIVAVIGNMLPVPIIYFFARRVLIWGSHKSVIGPFFPFLSKQG